jgi:hypothetical protein
MIITPSQRCRPESYIKVTRRVENLRHWQAQYATFTTYILQTKIEDEHPHRMAMDFNTNSNKHLLSRREKAQ